MNAGLYHWNGRLTDRQVQLICASNEGTAAIADKFKVNPRYVRKLRAGHARKDVRR